ncbi:MAG: heavy metal efflux outer membrane protein CzcC family [Sediminibacterium sp.]|nr:heavy metal efflux outer membrane protein CzcC family [Sediminibacterium sp.]
MVSHIYAKRCLVALAATIFLFSCLPAQSQPASIDTFRLSLPAAEKRLLDSNLLLLASNYNTDAQKALIQQAKLWDNPILNTDQAISGNGKFFPHSKNPDGSYNGQYYVQIQQLIRTAGKRGKLINLAGTNARLSELSLQEVLRNLRYQLRKDYYELALQLGTRKIYESQLLQLNKLLSSMQLQFAAGNIAQKDLLRMQALVISLEQDRADIDKSMADTQAELRTLLQVDGAVFIVPDDSGSVAGVQGTVDPAIAFETAKKYNPAYLLQQAQVVLQQQNLLYQKALRIPDITVGPNFDRNSSYTPNYVGIGISLPLPVFNKNQGNIRSAGYSIKQQQSVTANAEAELKNAILAACEQLSLTRKQNGSSQQSFIAQYQTMYGNIVQSYRERQINLLEFLDFFNGYTASQQRLLQQQLNLQLAKEQLNYQAGIDIIK